MYILGISCHYHDAAAVLLKNGEVVAASQEERFTRKKHDPSFPNNAIDFCLKQGNITSKDLKYVVFYEKPFKKFHRIILSIFSTYPKSYSVFKEAMRIWLTQKLWIKQEIASYLKIDHKKILFCEHHLSHAASCFYPSPYKKAAILTIDGVGEWTTGAIGIGDKNKIKLIKELHFPQSLGLLYSAFTAFLGYRVNSGEWKVMGLAPYGEPKYVDKVRKVVKQHSDGSFSLDFSYFSFPHSDSQTYSRKFINLFGDPIPPDQSHNVTSFTADIAASIQLITEKLLLKMAKYVKEKTKLDYLCLSGGVALNSVANFRLLCESGFNNIYIQPAAGDSGGALGAALYVYHHVLGKKKRQKQTHAYFGKEYTNSNIEKFLEEQNIKYKKLSKSLLLEKTVDFLEKGKVIGWMQGKHEWGPRALGARSIIADPRHPKMKDIINAKVKFRETFRPFAPSILADKASVVLKLPTKPHKHLPLKFMLYVVPVKKSWQLKIPAINHINNTARPQMVFKEDNQLYYDLINFFFQETGAPLILNTSFNLRGEPIVNSPYDAYSTFVRSGIDALIMGNYLCEK